MTNGDLSCFNGDCPCNCNDTCFSRDCENPNRCKDFKGENDAEAYKQQ